MKLMVAKAERAEVEKEAASSARKALVPRLNAECFNFPDPRRNWVVLGKEGYTS
jgi:hypothetical protein